MYFSQLLHTRAFHQQKDGSYYRGAYNSGKHGNLREFVNSGKLREFKIYSWNLSDAVDCYMVVSLSVILQESCRMTAKVICYIGFSLYNCLEKNV